MSNPVMHTSAAGADAGAMYAAAGATELDLTMASADAAHLGAYLAARTPPLPVRLGRTWMAAIRAARTEWRRREPVTPPVRVPGPATA
jgi:hypothetical protein